MNIQFSKERALTADDRSALMIGWTEGATKPDPIIQKSLPTVGPLVEQAIKEKTFTGKSGQCFPLVLQGPKGLENIVIVGLGAKKNCSVLECARAFGTGLRILERRRKDRVTVILPSAIEPMCDGVFARSMVLALEWAAYHFLAYKTDFEEPPVQIKNVEVVASVSDRILKELRQNTQEGLMIAELYREVRDVGNTPASDATPTYIANVAQRLSKGVASLRIKVLDKEGIKKAKMGGVWGVSKGSAEHPRFVELEYAPKGAKTTLAFVGKGVTFDSGGISIKPSEKMDEMKFDMAGGAAVIGAVIAIAKLKIPVRIVGLVPLTENLPSGEAYKPGDVLKTYGGKTIEVANTDAEGRVILADALSYAGTFDPVAIVDVATLTGSAMVALGAHFGALMGNNEKLLSTIKEIGDGVGEPLWILPMTKEHTKEIKSDIADVKNTGMGWGAGMSTAAAFLQEFLPKDKKGATPPWAHLDIAGTAWLTSEKPWADKGATGTGLLTLIELAKKYAKRVTK